MSNRLLLSPGLHFCLIGISLWLLFSYFSEKYPPIPAQPTSSQLQQKAKALGFFTVPDNPSVLMRLEESVRNDNLLFIYGLDQNFHRHDDVIVRRLEKNLDFIRVSECKHWCVDQAIDLGLHLYDPVIRARVLQLVGLQLKNRVRESGYRFYNEEVVQESITLFSFRHCFYPFSASDKNVVGARERAKKDFPEASSTGNCPGQAAFYQGPMFAGLGTTAIAKIFGEGFARYLAITPSGGWQGPVLSEYGYHLVRLDEKIEKPVERVRKVVNQQAVLELEKLKSLVLSSVLKKYGVYAKGNDSKDVNPGDLGDA